MRFPLPALLGALALTASAAQAQVPGAARDTLIRVERRGVESAAPAPGVTRGVRGRIDRIRGRGARRVIQPVIVVVPAPSSPPVAPSADARAASPEVRVVERIVDREGRTQYIPVPGYGAAPGSTTIVLPGGAPADTAKARTTLAPGPTQLTPPPLPRDPLARLPRAEIPREVVREVERTLLETGLFRAAGVVFEFNRAALLDGADRTLDAVGDVLGRYPSLRVEIGGHTDSIGSDAYNLALSGRRAETVRAYLVERWGIAPERLAARGYGEVQPVSTNANPTGRTLNRRVEFKVVGQ